MAAYVKQTWTDRVSEHPSRRKMENVSGNSFDLIRDEGVIVEEGTPLNAEHFNHMEDGIANAAVPDGNYPNMSVGNAEQLGASHDVTVSDEFLYRPTAGNIDVRDDTDENAEIKAIYGKTVIWNQISNDNTPILLSFSATGLKTVGFNQYSGEAEIGLTHNAQGVWSYSANTNLGMTEKIRVIPGETYKFALSTPMANTYVYSCYYDVDGNLISARNSVSMLRTVTIPSGVYFIRSYFYHSAGFDEGLNICVNLSHSGYRDGEYKPYHTETLPLPIRTYFSNGMKSVGTVKDELTRDMAVKRIGNRTYQQGDEDDPSVLTDGTNTFYVLASPISTPINPPLDFTYRVEDFGTEEVLLPDGAASTPVPMTADISYVQNLRDKLDHLPFNPGVPGDYIVHFDGVVQTYRQMKMYTHSIFLSNESYISKVYTYTLFVLITNFRKEPITKDEFVDILTQNSGKYYPVNGICLLNSSREVKLHGVRFSRMEVQQTPALTFRSIDYGSEVLSEPLEAFSYTDTVYEV